MLLELVKPEPKPSSKRTKILLIDTNDFLTLDAKVAHGEQMPSIAAAAEKRLHQTIAILPTLL
jgi:hypothetical protein